MTMEQDGFLAPVQPCKRPVLLDGTSAMSSQMQWYGPPRRKYTRRELLADRCVNFFGAGLSWIAASVLCFASWNVGNSVPLQLGCLAHGLGLIAMLNCSAFYHYLCWDWTKARRLYSLDHIGISAMIMGAVTPLTIYLHSYITLSIVWVLGLVGWGLEVFKLCRPDPDDVAGWTLLDKVNVVRYLVMGWVALPQAPALWSANRAAVCVSMFGGLTYSLGIIIFAQGDLEFHLAYWHTFVFVASFSFYAVIFLVVVAPDLF